MVLHSRSVNVWTLNVGRFVVSGFPSYLSMCLALEWEECNTHAMTDTIHATVRHTVIAMIIIFKSDF